MLDFFLSQIQIFPRTLVMAATDVTVAAPVKHRAPVDGFFTTLLPPQKVVLGQYPPVSTRLCRTQQGTGLQK